MTILFVFCFARSWFQPRPRGLVLGLYFFQITRSHESAPVKNRFFFTTLSVTSYNKTIFTTITENMMEMKEINNEDVCAILNSIMEYELAGVVRYTHSSLMVTGPYRLPIVNFLKEQASESLLHSQQAGELIVGLDGHPSQKIAKIEETNRHTIKDILEEALEHELHALSLYKKLLVSVADASIYLEEYARGLIGEEEQHSLELKAMLKDFGSI